VRGKFFRPLKTQASVRIDADVMEWLKRPGKGYQTRLNAILRERLARINARAPVYTVVHGDIDLSQLFNTSGFMLEENVLAS
ncbi:BrnA antitoxin family protein, partial [Salmonella enterica]|uniref:BrnA antitoxin family protein n=1 Tax=Salmonella enterica TaxID=28901 RepID=UPI0020CB9DE5